MQCVILCGGLGTRLRSVVADRPKSLALVAGKPFLLHLMSGLTRQGVDRFLLATGYLSEQIEAEFPGGQFDGADVRVSREPKPLGTGGALRHAADLLADDFLVVNGDTWMETSLPALGALGRRRNFAGVLTLRRVPDVGRYGAVQLDATGAIEAFVEKGAQSGEGLINGGVYWLRKELVTAMPEGKVSLEADIFPKLLGGQLGGIISNGRFIDIGIPEDLALAQELLADLRR